MTVPKKNHRRNSPDAWVMTGPTTMRRTTCLDPHDRWDVLMYDQLRLYEGLCAGHIAPAEYNAYLTTIRKLMTSCLRLGSSPLARAWRAA